MIFYHRFHNVRVKWNTDFSTLKFVEIFHWLWLTVCSYNNFDVFREVFGEPEGNIALFSIISIHKIVYSLEDQNNFVVKNIQIFNRLILYPLIADIKPVRKILSKFFLMKFNFLINIELFSKFYQNAINGIEIITIVSSCCCKMEDDKVIVFFYSF